MVQNVTFDAHRYLIRGVGSDINPAVNSLSDGFEVRAGSQPSDRMRSGSIGRDT